MADLQQILQLTRIRVMLFLREPEAVFWVFFFPVIIAIVLGWAFSEGDPEESDIGVLIADAATDGPIADTLEAVELLDVRRFTEVEDARRALRLGKIAVLVRDSGGALEFDTARPESELARLRIRAALQDPTTVVDREEVRIEARGSRYVDWLFPGLVGMNIMGTGIWGIGFGLAEWRQKKLLRRFLVTPMRRSSFLLSSMLSRYVFLSMEVTIILGFGLTVLGVPLSGSILGAALLIAFGGATFAAMGILVASRARTIEGVSGLMNLVMMPMWLFSGVFFSYERFPEIAHPVIRALPLTALNDGMRRVFLEEAGIAQVASELGVLAAWGIGSFVLATRIFRWE